MVEQGPAKKATARWVFVVVAIAVVFAVFVRVRLSSMPIERDEGEFAYAGQLLLKGIAPYKLAWNMKLPGTYVAYAAIMAVLGETATGIHLGLLVLNLLTMAAVFAVARVLVDDVAAAVAAAAWAVVSASPVMLGLAAHATHFINLPVLLGLLLLLRRRRVVHDVVAGVCFGVAVLMKQHAIVYGLLVLVVIWEKTGTPRWQRAVAVVVGGAVPGIVVVVWLVVAGVFERFWFWTVEYARAYVSLVDWRVGLHTFSEKATQQFFGMPTVWLMSLIGLVLLGRSVASKEARVLGALFVCSILATAPGLYFRSQYWLVVTPSLALLSGVAVSRLWQKKAAAAAVAIVGLGGAVVGNANVFFVKDPADVVRDVYGYNFFASAPAIAEYIKSRTKPDDRIAILGSEPQLYFYSDRIGATGYIYTYPLMEAQPFAHQMQEDMIREIETSKPSLVLYLDSRFSWLPHHNSDPTIQQWFRGYEEKHLTLIGMADLRDDNTVDLRFDVDPNSDLTPHKNGVLWIFKQRD